MISQARKFSLKKFSGVMELVDAGKQVFQASKTTEWTSKADIPNERTVRFYLDEGLVPRPDKGKKQSLPFEYSHLVTLLLIKRLRALGISIVRIKELIAGKSTQELERLLDDRIEVFTSRSSLDEFIETQGKQAGEEVVEIYDADARNEYLAKKNESSVSNVENNEPTDNMKFRNDSETWIRITISDGLEIHISERFRLPTSGDDRRLLSQALEEALANIKKLRR